MTLALIGVAALAGCGEQKRDVYASREDCLADWGNKPEDCTAATQPSHRASGFYYGPSYRVPWWRGSDTYAHGVTPRSRGSVASGGHVARGGFGSSGHAAGG